MKAQCVWLKDVNARRAVGFVTDGYGRLVFDWDDRVWRFWKHLVWDGREDLAKTQPPEVDAYLLNPAELRLLLGITPKEDVTSVLFIVFDGQDGDWTPAWAAVASDTPLEDDDEDV